ncbi:MAG: hypothetical protein KatS3mg002_0423 [Candidatus Woesearchaeota archaeon]|nr:MAG: hypothetical protein KatS3mg002_0423 [Candidatus Woesearchaeota archaeon]
METNNNDLFKIRDMINSYRKEFGPNFEISLVEFTEKLINSHSYLRKLNHKRIQHYVSLPKWKKWLIEKLNLFEDDDN